MSSTDTAAETTETAETEADAPAGDERREALLAELRDHLGDAVLDAHLAPGHDLWIRIPREEWVAVHRALRDHFEFRFFEFLTAIDWLDSPFGRYEDSVIDEPDEPGAAEPGELRTGVAGGETRFQLLSRLFDVRERHLGVLIKCDLPDDDLSVPSLINVFPGANWHEREIAEMFGIDIPDHPYLEKLYLPTDFEGYPLRKDYPLVSRIVKPWPGIVDVEPMPDEGDDEEGEEA